MSCMIICRGYTGSMLMKTFPKPHEFCAFLCNLLRVVSVILLYVMVVDQEKLSHLFHVMQPITREWMKMLS